MIESALAELASDDIERVNSLIWKLASEWSSYPALAICFAITSAAAKLEEEFQGQQLITYQAYKLGSLLAADIFAIESMGQLPAQGHHLLHFWRRS